MDYITIGEIINVRGIKGEVKIRPLTSDITRFSRLRLVYIDSRPYKILGHYIEKGFVYLSMAEVSTRNDAEKLKGKFLTIDAVNAIDLEEGEHFIHELLGMEVVFDSGEVLGTIQNIDQFGSADVFTVKLASGKMARFPFLNRIVLDVDYTKRQFRLIKERFDEVAVFDD